MAGESCNLNKDEAEILKPSSSSSPSSHPSPPPPAAAPPSSLFLKPPLPQEFPAPERPGRFLEAPPPPAVDAVASAPQQNSKQEPHSRPTTTAPAPVPFVNRCSSCHKRVGLTGFRCRCGDLFCPRHRHSDTHECSFDYKTVGREQIAKANPLIRAAKIIKI